MSAANPVEVVRAYHERTKHRLDKYADGPGSLDWDAQPDAFRRWRDTAVVPLPRDVSAPDCPWSALAGARPAQAATLAALSVLLRHAVALTAWKQYGDSRWSLRAHPSSGNLHPTETWVCAIGVDGLQDGLYHYQARDHSLEQRADGPADEAAPGLWLGFSSIAWREAWKYGERAFRYCQLDMGHVLAAVAYAAALNGWSPRLLPFGHDAVAALLGLDRPGDFAGVETEEADAILALTGAAMPPGFTNWHGRPSLLDPHPMYRWPVIEEVAEASRGPLPDLPPSGPAQPAGTADATDIGAARVLLKRRSAQAFDGSSVMPGAVFRRLLASLLPGGSPTWRLWTAAARIHPVLFVHRVEGLAPGLYVLPRSAAGQAGLRAALRPEFGWEAADTDLPLYQLIAAKAERTARTVSCHQDIASRCAVAVMFVAEFAAPIAQSPAAWRHLHWEAGMLGHCLGLEAEAAGWRGTGIGCFFDDAGREILGLADDRYQVVYHFSVGMAVDDPRLTTLPAYD
jgi:SagB-type dehydrogenase family enzyme